MPTHPSSIAGSAIWAASFRRCNGATGCGATLALTALAGTHPFRALRYARSDRVFRQTLISWMFLGFATLMIGPLRVEYLANPKHGVTLHGAPLTAASIAMLTGVIPNIARLLLNFLRSIPELVWAALMVFAAGLGPLAGTLALAWHTTGVIGRLFAETLENAPPEPARSLVESGAAPALAFVYATLPLITPQLIAYSLYRWEMNIRMATVLGFVGAGGLGQMLYYELSLLHEPQACTVIAAMLALVVVVDAFSAWVRRRQIRAGG